MFKIWQGELEREKKVWWAQLLSWTISSRTSILFQEALQQKKTAVTYADLESLWHSGGALAGWNSCIAECDQPDSIIFLLHKISIAFSVGKH